MTNLKNQENLSLKEKQFQLLKEKKVTLYNINQLRIQIDHYYDTYCDFDSYEFLIDRLYIDYTLLFGAPLNLN